MLKLGRVSKLTKGTSEDPAKVEDLVLCSKGNLFIRPVQCGPG